MHALEKRVVVRTDQQGRYRLRGKARLSRQAQRRSLKTDLPLTHAADSSQHCTTDTRFSSDQRHRYQYLYLLRVEPAYLPTYFYSGHNAQNCRLDRPLQEYDATVPKR